MDVQNRYKTMTYGLTIAQLAIPRRRGKVKLNSYPFSQLEMLEIEAVQVKDTDPISI